MTDPREIAQRIRDLHCECCPYHRELISATLSCDVTVTQQQDEL